MPSFILPIIIGLIVAAVLLLFLPVILAVAVGVGIGFGVWFYLDKTKKESGEAVSSPQEAEVSPADQAIESLLDANLNLRRAVCPPTVVEHYESLIDKLLELVPMVNDEAANTELAWVINQMSNDYLPVKSLAPYLGLDKPARHDQATIDEVVQGIDAMSAELDDVRGLIQQRKSGEFDRKAEFLKRRFE